ncbi:hypothetical protein AYR66_04240 [Noviherbaspirillum denitrificans]|uniref:Secreted protein n=1 Tax=Noviherbaspirillum denitrificans TaxID=1968433 RepID=A0A254T9E0_9BURK|nr:hypothetical protein AYR66_04240 [Noviherbaspirillum denitrificans]
MVTVPLMLCTPFFMPVCFAASAACNSPIMPPAPSAPAASRRSVERRASFVRFFSMHPLPSR